MKTNIENTTKILEVKKMNKTEFDFKSRTIREVFSDTRKICIAPKHEIMLDEGVHPGGDIFTTEDGEYIDFETQLKDFDAEELAKYVEFVSMKNIKKRYPSTSYAQKTSALMSGNVH